MMPRHSSIRFWSPIAAVLYLIAADRARAGFASSEQFLPAVGQLTLAGGTQALTTIWATNLTGAPVSFTFSFLKQGQANTSPAKFTDTLAAGETKVYENVIGSKLGLTNALGGARVVSTGEILVAERILNQAPGADLGETEGLFFAGVPKAFSISAGQSASIQGLNQGGSENFRYNFALVETGGGSPTVSVQVFDGGGALLGQKAFPLSPFEQIQPNVAEVVPGFSSINARITATVTGGSGSVLLAGAQVANESLDSSGFEMSFRDELLGGGGTAGVTSLNGLTGAVTLAHGANTTVNVNGQTITIDSVGGGAGSGLTAVAHDNTLVGSGTVGVPLGVAAGGVGNSQLGAGAVTTAKIAAGQVVTSVNGLHDAVTLSAGSNVTITPSGNGLTIAASGGGGGGLTAVAHDATLTGDGTGGNPMGIAVPVSLSTSSSPVMTLSSSAPGLGGVLNVMSGCSPPNGDSAIVACGSGGTPAMTLSMSNPSVGQNTLNVSRGCTVSFESSAISACVPTGTGIAAEIEGGSTGLNVAFAKDTGISTTAHVALHAIASSTAANTAGIFSEGQLGSTGTGTAGVFHGAVSVTGNVNVTGSVSKTGGSFKIDHPLDPAHKYLYHSFVESPDMKNVYDGVATLDASGTATIALPEWFEALNRDFRYQLTALDTPQPGLFVSSRVKGNAFRIAGGVPGAQVSWQLTGTRHDAWADAHRIRVEEPKPGAEDGTYLHPELFGEPEAKSLAWAQAPGRSPEK